MLKPKNSVMSNAKGCVMDNLEDLHNWNVDDIMTINTMANKRSYYDNCEHNAYYVNEQEGY